MTRRRVVLTITLSEPEDRYLDHVQLRDVATDVLDYARLTARHRGLVYDAQIHHLQQQDDALWETVGREG